MVEEKVAASAVELNKIAASVVKQKITDAGKGVSKGPWNMIKNAVRNTWPFDGHQQNAPHIAQNAANQANNAAKIGHNVQNIGANAQNIAVNADHIAANGRNIDLVGNIALNNAENV